MLNFQQSLWKWNMVIWRLLEGHVLDQRNVVFRLFTLPETNSEFTPENGPGPKRKRSSSKHPFSGAL